MQTVTPHTLESELDTNSREPLCAHPLSLHHTATAYTGYVPPEICPRGNLRILIRSILGNVVLPLNSSSFLRISDSNERARED